ncbi:MAG: hypothetical protein CHACPFDD_01058 [Phycisphaerae bacterium]|nr:hypothetical protein [Phycisphaerae bacterium]
MNAISLTVNGEPAQLGDVATVADLVARLGLSPQRVAIEVNQTLVRRADYRDACLRNGDRVEIVTLVGGG